MTRPAVQQALAIVDQEIDLIYARLSTYPWDQPRGYAQWLAQTYFYTRHASRVSAHAVVCTPVERVELHDHLVRTINEEKDHPPMVIDDLRELGFEIGDFREHPLTSAFYQTLHYHLDRSGPAALIGYFFVIEGAAAKNGPEIFDLVKRSHHGKGLSFLEEHVIADAAHYPAARQFVASLSDGELDVIARCSVMAATIYRAMLDAMREDAGI